jgi:methionyl-tRNA formyltransferase
MKRVIFLGSKAIGYQCLSYLITHHHLIDIEIIGVLGTGTHALSQSLNLLELAKEHNIQVFETLSAMPESDLLYSVQYHQILKQSDINKAKLAVNLHMAPLPEYRGANQFSIALIENKQEFGTTIHIMDNKIDHGAILFEDRFAIPINCHVSQLYDITAKSALQLFTATFTTILNKAFEIQPQENLVAARGSSLHFKKEMQTLKQIDITWPVEKIALYIRATSMPGFEPPYCMIDDKKIYFTLGNINV